MALDDATCRALFDAVKSHALSLGVFGAGVETFEPSNAPGTGLALAIWLGPITPDLSSGLDAVSVRIEFLLRIYSPMMQRPLEDIDPAVLSATSTLLAAYCGAFTLGGLVREVDVMGLQARPAYLHQDGKEYRVMEITLPLVLNDAWQEVA